MDEFKVGDVVRIKASVKEPKCWWGDPGRHTEESRQDAGILRRRIFDDSGWEVDFPRQRDFAVMDGEIELATDVSVDEVEARLPKSESPSADDLLERMRAMMGFGRSPGAESFFSPVSPTPEMVRISGETKPEEPQKPSLTWDDVKGQDEAKWALREAVELPLKYPKLYQGYGKRPSKGVLLYGPPGCGKTMLGRAMCAVLGTGEEGFRYIKGPELRSEMWGKSESNIRNVFKKAAEFKKRTGKPQVVFIDEPDAFLGRRASGGERADATASEVTTMLAEMDGLEAGGAFVILATNRPDGIDPAILREGRIDRKIRVGRPSREVCGDILRAGFGKSVVVEGLDAVEVALAAVFDVTKCYAAVETDDRGTVRVLFSHTVSGALLDGLVERATANAIHRDIEAGCEEPSGIIEDDILRAVDAMWRSTWDTCDTAELAREVTEGATPISIKTFHGRKLHHAGETSRQKVEVTHKVEIPGDSGSLDGAEE